MRFIKIRDRAVSSLRTKLGITQQELAARVGCSLSAVQFWEAGRSSPRGYRLRRLIELCPDPDTRALFLPAASSRRSSVTGPKSKSTGCTNELERYHLDPAFLYSLPVETRTLYHDTVKNVLALTSMKMQGSQVAAEGLRLLAETIAQIAGMATPPPTAPSARAAEDSARSDKPKD